VPDSPDKRPVAGRRVVLRRPRLTGRSMLVAAMALFLLILLASPFQTYLSRRASVATSHRQEQQLDARVAQLQQQLKQWQDPAFVERQARVRLQYIRPGDTLYTVLNAAGQPIDTPAAATSVKAARVGHQPSWNDTLMASVREADASK
jgi:cell division protein FtsB